MKIWNFGIIGAGMIADFHAKAIADIDNAKLIAVCDINKVRADEMSAKYKCKSYGLYQKLCSDKEIDVITIATPSGLHAEPVIAAAKAGKHVICEKPLEVTLDRIDAMIEAHEKAGTQLGCIFQNRFTDAMEPLREAIEKGRFGKITYAGVYVPWWRSDEYYKGNWRGTWKLDGGGALMNQSIHMIDMLCDLMPPVESVKSFTATLGHDIETEDTAVACLKFTNGALGIIYGATSSWPGQFKRFEISGTKGTVVYLEDSVPVWQFIDEQPEDEAICETFSRTQGQGGFSDPAAIAHTNHARNFRAFLESLDSEKKFNLDGREGRKAVELIMRIYNSSKL
ncbi:MAG: hypothetical protein A2Y13_05385 [Planctomycetes bacterium GWC2_45_44]|nr:MAG: hypothetical protein A2Y13_05385 [Planctomycetes bacterium GWC2_45_44]